jgi:hypothetical protein
MRIGLKNNLIKPLLQGQWFISERFDAHTSPQELKQLE